MDISEWNVMVGKKMVPIVKSGTMQSCSLIGVGVALLEEVCYFVWSLMFEMLKLGPVSCSILLPWIGT